MARQLPDQAQRKTKMTYGKSVLISRQAAYQRNRNVVTISASRKGLGPISNAIVLVLVVCLLGLMYLTQVTRTNALGYKLSELTTRQSQLKEEYASLEVESVRLQSLERVQTSTVTQSMNETKPTAFATD